MRKNKILGRVAACVAAGVLVLSSCTACGVNIYSTMDGQSMIQELDPDGKPKLYSGDINELIKKFQK